MAEKIQTTYPLKVRIKFTPKTPCILLGRTSTKVVEKIGKFRILDFLNFCCRFR